MQRRVRERPPSSLNIIPSENSFTSSWRDEIEGDEFAYESSFEEYISEEEDATDAESQPVEWSTIDLKNGVKLLVPENTSEFRCKAIPLGAEKRTEMLSQFPHYHDETMVSEVYELKGEDIESFNCKPKYLQIPLVLPTTRLDVNVLFRFHVMVLGNSGWIPVPAQYEDCLLKFPIQEGKYFVAYARPIPEFRKISWNAFTFVSDKDKRIKVHFGEGAVDREMTFSFKVQPMDTDRLEHYRVYDPLAFEGIYALSDILSVQYNMDKILNIDTTVELPIADLSKEEYELKYISMDGDSYAISDLENKSCLSGVAIMPHTVSKNKRFRIALVRKGLPPGDLAEASRFQEGKTDPCTILMFISKEAGGRWLTVEVVRSDSADTTTKSRHQRNYFEIHGSRSRTLWIHLGDRIRVNLAGNMRSAEQVKKTKYTFQYIHQSRNNFIQFRTQKVASGSAYSILEVSVAGKKVHEVHFSYPDAGYNLKDVKNLCTYRIATRDPTPVVQVKSSSSRGTSDTGYNTGISERQTNSHRETTPPASSESVPAFDDESDMGSSASSTTSDGESSSSRSSLSSGSMSHNRPTTSNAPGRTRPEVPVSSSTPSEHPVWTQQSLLVLGRHVTLRDCQDVLMSLEMKFDTIRKIKQEAKDQDVNDVFLLLLRWYQESTMDSVLLIKKLEDAFKEIGRSDLSQIIAKVRNKRRGFKNEDFN